MRIISDSHDYYDCVQSVGQDLSIIWNRKPKLIKYTKQNWVLKGFEYFISRYKSCADVDPFVVGFCGKIYPGIRIHDKELNKKIIAYSLEEVDEFVHSTYKNKAIKEYYIKSYNRWCPRNEYLSHHLRQVFIEKFFNTINEAKDKFQSLFIEHHTPVFFSDLAFNIEFNYCDLKKLEFYRKFDSFTAFQEITMFYSNFGEPEKVIPKVNDKAMVEIKGFDKFSFRKEKKIK